MEGENPKLDTHFIKNSDFKTVYGSGFYGGFTPAGLVNVFVYTERVPIPNRISFQVEINSETNSASVGSEIEREGRSGLVREVQVGILFDVETTQSLVDWLQGKLNEYRRAEAKQKQSEP